MKTQPVTLESVLGRRLGEARKKTGMTQRRFAAALDVSLSHVSQVERGHKTLSLAVLSRWARLCRIATADLFVGLEAALAFEAEPVKQEGEVT